MLEAAGNGDHMAGVARAAVDRRPFRNTAPKVRSDRLTLHERLETTWIDLVFLIALGASAIAYLNISRRTYFWGEDWPLALRGYALGDFPKPYNGQLSIVTVAIYRVLYKGFGFDSYVPWRLLAVGALLSVPVALYCVARRNAGPFLAGIAAIYMMWYPHTTVTAANFAYYIAA